jgi:hypothetical protein
MSATRSRNAAGRFVSSKPATVATVTAKPAVATVTAKPAAFTAPEHGWPVGTETWAKPATASRKLSADERDRLTSSAINRSRVSVFAALLAAATGAAILATWINSGDMGRTMKAAASYVDTFRPAVAAVEYSEPRWLLTMATNVAGFSNEISVETGSVSECFAVAETLRKLRAATGNTDCQRTR